MADVHSKEVRSFNMSKIRSKNTQPEMLVRKFLHKNGFRYRLHVRKMPGKPDIVLKKYRTIVFVHGCFWHGHGACKLFKIPKTKTEWWENKITRNQKNFHSAACELERLGYKVLIVWECDLKKQKRTETLNRLLSQIRCNDQTT